MTAWREVGMGGLMLGFCVALLGCPGGDVPATSVGTGSTSGADATTVPGPPTTDDGPSPTTRGAPPTTTDTGAWDSTTVGGAASTGSTDSTGDSGSTSSESTDSGGSESTGAPLIPCDEGCGVEFMCTKDWPSIEACVDACEANLIAAGKFAPICAMAWEAVALCVGELTCEEYAEFQDPIAIPYPCISEDEGLVFECKGQ